VLEELLEEELLALAGPKGKHNRKRTASRHGSRSGQVVLGGRKVQVRRARARSLEGRELPLRTYTHFASDGLLCERTVETMLAGLSTRRHRSLEPTGTEDRSVSKSAVSRRFVAGTRRSLAELLWQALIIVAAVITVAVLSFFGLYVTALAGVKIPSLTSGSGGGARRRRRLRQPATSCLPAPSQLRWRPASRLPDLKAPQPAPYLPHVQHRASRPEQENAIIRRFCKAL
jgi:hypothetical protein